MKVVEQVKNTFIEFLSFIAMSTGLFLVAWAIGKYEIVAYITLVVILLVITGGCILMYRKKK